MPATIVEIGDAVVEVINDSGLLAAWNVEAQRSYQATYELTDTSTLIVPVVPISLQYTALARGLSMGDFRIDVGVMKRNPQAQVLTTEELDELVLLVEQLLDLFRGKTLADEVLRCIEILNEPVFSSAHLAELNQFTSVVAMTFKRVRAVT